MGKRLIIAGILTAAAFAVPVSAQDEDGRRILDDVLDRVEGVIRRIDDEQTEEDQPQSQTQIIDFEAIRSRDGRTPAVLTNQYEQSHGVRFGPGVSVHRCTGAYDEFSTSQCPYRRASSGERAAMFDVETGGPAMTIDFVEPADAVSWRINPTGGGQGVRYVAQAVGLDVEGETVAVAREDVAFGEANLSWPYGLTLRGERPIVRVQIALAQQGASLAAVRVNNNQSVRFFIDDLAITRADAPAQLSPVAAALAAQDGPPKAGRAEIVQSSRIGAAQSGLRLYPAATRKRLAIDWDAADAVLVQQDALGLAAVTLDGASREYADRAELPLLLPQAGEAGSLQVFGGADVVNIVWRANGRDYSVYASRLATVIRKAQGASGVQSAITFSGSEDELTASFSLFGASYTLSQHCNGGASVDPACHDRDALGRAVEGLVVFVGETGRTRP